MPKKALAELLESMCERIVANSGGMLDANGARAVLGMAIRQAEDDLIAAALPNNSGRPRIAEATREVVAN